MTLKVFQMNDYEWYMGETLEDAIAAQKRDYPDMPEGELLSDPGKLTETDLHEHTFYDEAGTRTFKEQLEKRIAEGAKAGCFAMDA